MHMSSTTLRQRQRKARFGYEVAPRTYAIGRSYLSVTPDIHVQYPDGMPGPVRAVDREAWAAEVARLIRDEADGNKSEFARMVGLKTVKTVDRWLAGTVAVSPASVAAVARALRLSSLDLYRTVGLLPEAEDLPPVAGRDRQDAQARRIIEEANIPPHLKRELLDHLRQQRDEHERQRLVWIERLVSFINERERPGRAG